MSSTSDPQDAVLDRPSVQSDPPVGRSWGAFTLAAIEAICVFSVAAARSGLVLGSAGVFVAGWAEFLHRDVFRIPALLVAIGGAVVNLLNLWRAHRQRNMPSASWRKVALTGAQRFRIGLILSLSVITILLAGLEIHYHRLFHHTII